MHTYTRSYWKMNIQFSRYEGQYIDLGIICIEVIKLSCESEYIKYEEKINDARNLGEIIFNMVKRRVRNKETLRRIVSDIEGKAVLNHHKRARKDIIP